MSDANGRAIVEMRERREWAALLQYGLVHRLYRPALDAALDLLENAEFGNEYSDLRAWLNAFRESPNEPHKIPDTSGLKLDADQCFSLQLVATYPAVALCELGRKYPSNEQRELLQLGLATANQWRQLAVEHANVQVEAVAHGFMARARLELGDLQESIASYEMALAADRQLAAARPEVYQQRVPGTLNNLGNALLMMSQWEDAVVSFTEALSEFRQLATARPDVYLENVATTLNNLGGAQRALSQFEDAVTSYEEALAAYRQLVATRSDMYLESMAATLNNLGIVQCDLARWEGAVTSYRKALAEYRRLAVARPEFFLQYVAMTLNNLGIVQRALSQWNDSVTSYKEALVIRRRLAVDRPDVYLADVATTLNNLGTVQSDLAQLEDAVASYEEALVIRRRLAAIRPEVYLVDVAMTLNNLGTVLRDLSRLDDAIAKCAEALEIRRRLAVTHPDVYLQYVATTLNNLGNVQLDLSQLDGAVASFEEALEIRRQLAVSRPDAYLQHVATTLNNLGNVQYALVRFEDAVVSYKEALEILRRLAVGRPNVFLAEVATTLNNLGNVQSVLLKFEEAVANYEEARKLYQRFESHLGSSLLRELMRLFQNYANLVLRESPDQGWPDRNLARKLLRKAIAQAEGFRGLFGDPRERIRVQEEIQGLYAQQVNLCLECGELYANAPAYEEAMETAEASRSRSLLDALVRQPVSDRIPFELWDRFQYLQRDLRRAQRRLHQEWETWEALTRQTPKDADNSGDGDSPVQKPPSNSETPLSKPRYARSAGELSRTLSGGLDQQERITRITAYIQEHVGPYLALVEQIRTIDPHFQPDQTVDSFRMADRARIFPQDKRALFVHLECLDDRLLAMILTPNGLHPVSVPGLTRRALIDLVNAVWTSQRGTTSHMMAIVSQVLEILRPAFSEILIPAIAAAGLIQGDRLVLIPDEILGFLPLHAIPFGNYECLGDRFEVSYAPSLSVLQQCQQRQREEPTRLFGVIDPTETLAGPALEAALARRQFPDAEILTHIDHDSLLENARQTHVFYWMGHSHFTMQVPYWSGLLMQMSGLSTSIGADGTTKQHSVPVAPADLATFTDIDCSLTMEHCSLVILSGCQSGLALAGKGNEPISLVSAFLNAGAKCVVASLWPVDDGACLLTMQRFLQAWRVEGQGVAAALRTAQQWLRNLTAQELADWADAAPELRLRAHRDVHQVLRWTIAEEHIRKHGPDSLPYHSPYYWAPFVAVGHAWKSIASTIAAEPDKGSD